MRPYLITEKREDDDEDLEFSQIDINFDGPADSSQA